MAKKVLLLVSSMSMSREVAQNQERAKTLLAATGAGFTEVDGSRPENKELRNELFSISGLRGQYPQLFLIEETKETKFLGNWDDIEAVNDASSLPEQVLQENPDLGTWDRLLDEDDEILLLFSSVAGRETVQRQERAHVLLQAHGIHFHAVDGADPSNKAMRKTLFEISGAGVQYPQFFVQRKTDKTTFLGNWEGIEAINDASRLPTNVLEANPSIITWEKVLG